jgi:hypothetical protein
LGALDVSAMQHVGVSQKAVTRVTKCSQQVNDTDMNSALPDRLSKLQAVPMQPTDDGDADKRAEEQTR